MRLENKHCVWLKEPDILLPHITTQSSAASPYSSFVPYLMHNQAFAQEPWICNTTQSY
jgi:hypothetical protein